MAVSLAGAGKTHGSMTCELHLQHVQTVWNRDDGNDENKLIRLNLVEWHVKDIDVVPAHQFIKVLVFLRGDFL